MSPRNVTHVCCVRSWCIYQSLIYNKQRLETSRSRGARGTALLPRVLAADVLSVLSVICWRRPPPPPLTFSPPTRKRSAAAMLTLMPWQRSWRTSLMEAPGRRVMEEQEPSGSITLQCLEERSHTPTEWRLSDYGHDPKKKLKASFNKEDVVEYTSVQL